MSGSLYRYLRAASGRLQGVIVRAEGQALVELALIVSLASMVTLGTISITGSSVRDLFGSISGSVAGPQTGATSATTPTTTTAKRPKVKKQKKSG